MLDPHAVGGEGDEQADLASHGGGKVALDELEDGEDDDGDDKEPREENPVELVEEAKVVAAVDNKATFSIEDHCGSEETISNHIVRRHCCTLPEKQLEEQCEEVDGDDDQPGKNNETENLRWLGRPAWQIERM